MNRTPNGRQWARVAVALVAAGFSTFVLGVFPGLLGLDLTPGIGLLQVTTFLLGLTTMTLGAYVYVYVTRQLGRPRRLPADIGLRLLATGLVLACVAGYADVLGIGAEARGEPLLFGPLQAAGVALGGLLIVLALIIYTRR